MCCCIKATLVTMSRPLPGLSLAAVTLGLHNAPQLLDPRGKA